MEIKAKLNYLRIAPRKVRLVTDLIKGMEVKQAENHLKFIPKRVSNFLLKLLQSAAANAQNNFKLDKDVLYIKEITVNEGTPFKRSMPVSRGRAFQVLKRISNINLVLGVKEGVELKKKPAEKAEPIQAGPPKSEGFGGKPKSIKSKAPKELIKGSKIKGLTKKIFRRKSF